MKKNHKTINPLTIILLVMVVGVLLVCVWKELSPFHKTAIQSTDVVEEVATMPKVTVPAIDAVEENTERETEAADAFAEENASIWNALHMVLIRKANWEALIETVNNIHLSKTNVSEGAYFIRLIRLMEENDLETIKYSISTNHVFGGDGFCDVMTQLVECYNKQYGTQYHWETEHSNDAMKITFFTEVAEETLPEVETLSQDELIIRHTVGNILEQNMSWDQLFDIITAVDLSKVQDPEDEHHAQIILKMDQMKPDGHIEHHIPDVFLSEGWYVGMDDIVACYNEQHTSEYMWFTIQTDNTMTVCIYPNMVAE